ncbi:hypothetical protein M5K25_008590 [Dendrobium thyrsiflorum]|uniref:Uncharacterized protein n=1 Tax=Dendrobium thyrsiflorum TaxID=117978 RepID=A0ABD0V9W0_DENTH
MKDQQILEEKITALEGENRTFQSLLYEKKIALLKAKCWNEIVLKKALSEYKIGAKIEGFTPNRAYDDPHSDSGDDDDIEIELHKVFSSDDEIIKIMYYFFTTNCITLSFLRLQQGGEALTKKSSFFLFHPYTVMAENPSSYLRQRTATLPFSPLLGDGREPSSFLRQRTATLPFSPLLGDGREPSSFLRQRTATLPFSPLLGDGREPSSFLRQRTATSFFTTPGEGREPRQALTGVQVLKVLPYLPLSPLPQQMDHEIRLQQGGEALTKKSSFFLFHPYTVMAENPSSYLRQRTATLPFSPLLGDGREPSSFLRQRTATLPFSPLLGDGREPSSFLGREPQHFLFHHSLVMAENPLPSSGREPQLPFSPHPLVVDSEGEESPLVVLTLVANSLAELEGYPFKIPPSFGYDLLRNVLTFHLQRDFTHQDKKKQITKLYIYRSVQSSEILSSLGLQTAAFPFLLSLSTTATFSAEFLSLLLRLFAPPSLAAAFSPDTGVRKYIFPRFSSAVGDNVTARRGAEEQS